ncbi:TPA: hypothetical protein HA361_03125 [Candidatus Woesearchaeota archaeon]|nr:hypothetical protein [Candidatus Woesearchaeota archaeon]HII69237.1 hypothetical protein [Candidatus Woesearchaeota archaeon]
MNRENRKRAVAMVAIFAAVVLLGAVSSPNSQQEMLSPARWLAASLSGLSEALMHPAVFMATVICAVSLFFLGKVLSFERGSLGHPAIEMIAQQKIQKKHRKNS